MLLAETFHQFSTGAMGGMAQVALHAAMASYLIAAVISLAALFAPGRARMKWADWTGAFGTGSLLLFFVARFSEAGLAPLSNLFEVLALSALCLALAYFVATRIKPMPALGGFAFPALAALFLVSLLSTGTSGGAQLDALLVLHVLLTVLAYGVFFMAAVAALMFLIQERALKHHQGKGFARNLPPLEALRKLLAQCTWIGLGVLTVGFALGFSSQPPSQWGALVLTPKVMTALVLWLVLLASVVGRVTGWLHGRRFSYAVLLGFALVLLTYMGLAFGMREGDRKPVARKPEVTCSVM